MDFTEYKIGLKEYFALVVLVIATAVSDDTPSIVIYHLKNAAWMQPLLSALIFALPLYLLVKVVQQHDTKSFVDIIMTNMGKHVGTGLLFLFWIIMSLRIIIDGAIYTDILESMFYPKTPTIIGFIVLFAVSGYLASKGIAHIASFAWIFLISIKLTFLFALLLAIRSGSHFFLFPLLGPGLGEVLKQSLLKSSIYLDFIFLAFLLPFLKSKKIFTKGSWLAFLFITFELTLAFMAFLMTFDYTTARLQNFPYHEILRYLHLGFLTNMESFFFPFWVLAAFIRFGFYLYINLFLLGHLFRFKQPNYLLPSLITLFILVGLMPQIPSFSLFSYHEQFYNITTFVMLSFPVLLWCFTLLKKRRVLNDSKNR